MTVQHEHGLHARPADLFVRTANRYSSDITVVNLTTNSKEVNAKSIIRILGLGINSQHTIKVTADGADELDAIEAIGKLIEKNFE
jgi:phosphotransferase system HPr (HPr) family protein